MTQSNTQSVRNKAVSAIESPRIPTFEEVYAMPYVQESIDSVITLAIHRYPILKSYRDDIRQVILIHLSDDLAKFNGRSGIKTFARLSINTGLKMAMREIMTEENYALYSAVDIDSVPDGKISEMGYFSPDPRSYLELKEIEDAIENISDPVFRRVAEMFLDGETGASIMATLGISNSTFYKIYHPRLKKFFRRFFPKTAVFGGGKS